MLVHNMLILNLYCFTHRPEEVKEEVFENECYKFSMSWQKESDPLHCFYRTAFLLGVTVGFTLKKTEFTVKRFQKKYAFTSSNDDYHTIGIK